MSDLTFVEMAHQLGGLLPPPTFTPEQIPALNAGREILQVIAAEVRALTPGSEPDFLMNATVLVGKGRPEVLQGFYRELQLLLARTQP